jgi:hypothetical protein
MYSFHSALALRCTTSRRRSSRSCTAACSNGPGSPCTVRRLNARHGLTWCRGAGSSISPARPVHPQQRHAAAHILQTAVGLAPIEVLAHPRGQLLAARLGMGPDYLAHPFDLLRAEQPTAVALVRFHARPYRGIALTWPAENTWAGISYFSGSTVLRSYTAYRHKLRFCFGNLRLRVCLFVAGAVSSLLANI